MNSLLKIGFLTFSIITILSARILTVDPYGGGVYDNIPSAVRNAAAGDTVFCLSHAYLLSASETEISVNKKLTLLGSGYDAVSGGGCSVETPGASAIFTFSGNSDGSVIRGFRFISNGTALSVTVDDVTIEENFFINISSGASLSLAGGKQDTVRSNIFTNRTPYSGQGFFISNTSDVLLSNNLLGGLNRGGTCQACTNLKICNNTFVDNSIGLVYGFGENIESTDDAAIHSNLFMNCDEGIISNMNPQTIKYNGFCNTIQNSNISTVNDKVVTDAGFVNYSPGDKYRATSPDDDRYDFHLKPDSPLIDSGFNIQAWKDKDGSPNDPGMYGGPWPFRDDFGIPDIPNVIEISITPGTLSPDGTITLSAKGRVGSGN